MPDAARSRDGGTALRTFLIADIRGYTYFTQTRGDEAAGRLAATFAEVAQEVVSAGGGRVQELRGDEALCVFESPRQAFRAAVELQARFVELTLRDPETPYGVGVGIDTGEAVRVKGGYRGSALNLAARLCSIAKAGEILASREAVHLAGQVDTVHFRERGRVPLKGIDRPTTVVEVVPRDNPADDPAYLLAVRPRQAEAAAVRRRRRRTLVAFAAAIAALIATDAAVLIDRAGRLEPLAAIGPNAIGVVDPGQAVLYDRVDLPLAGPGPMTAGGGTVWVTDTANNTLLGLDVARDTVAKVPVGPDPAGVAVGDGAVWVTSASSRRLIRVDPVSDQVVAKVQVGNGPTAVAAGAGGVWVANRLDSTVSVVDPKSDRAATVNVGAEPAAILVVDEAVWVANQGSATVSRIDARTDQVVATIPVGDLPSSLAYAGGAVWVANTLDGTVSKIDVASNAVTATVRTGGEPASVAADGDGEDVWVADGTGDRILHVTGTNVADVVPIGNAPVSMAFDAGRLWVSATGSAAAHRGGTLRVVDTFENAYNSLDPAVGYQTLAWSLEKDMYDGLVTQRHVGGPGGTLVVPDLARALPTVSDGGRTYTFQLRSGVSFSDGSTVHASDFRRSMIRMMTLLGDVVPYYESITGAPACIHDHRCDGVRRGIVVDDASGNIGVHLSKPDPELLYQLALPFASIVGPGAPAHDAGDAPLVGTGPYVLDPHPPRDHAILRRNPEFHPWSAAARPDGYPDVIDLSLVDGLTNRVLTRTTDGDYDVATDISSGSSLERLRAQAPTQLHPSWQLGTNYYFLNTGVSPFSNVLVRRAVNYALDRRKAADALGGAFFQDPTCQVLPPALSGYQPYCPYTAQADRSGTWKAPDLAAARRLVTRSGTKGDEIQVAVNPLEPGGTNALISTLRRLDYHVTTHGFPVTPSNDLSQAGGEYFAYITTPSNHAAAGLSGWLADYPAPSNFIQPTLTCGAIGTASNLNASEFCDHSLAPRLRDALRLQQTDAAAAGKDWASIDRLVTDQAPWVSISNAVGWDAVSPRVGNYQHHPNYGPMLDQMWVR